MGSKSQMYQGNLTVPGKNEFRGNLIVRAEGMKETNEIAHFQMKWDEVNNKTGGCLGMCRSEQPVFFRISRVLGDGNFAQVWNSQPTIESVVTQPE